MSLAHRFVYNVSTNTAVWSPALATRPISALVASICNEGVAEAQPRRFEQGGSSVRGDDGFRHIREVARPTPMDAVLLVICAGCFALLLVATRYGWEASGYAFCGSLAFSLWVLNIVNRVIGTLRELHDRVRRLELRLQGLLDDMGDEEAAHAPDERRN